MTFLGVRVGFAALLLAAVSQAQGAGIGLSGTVALGEADVEHTLGNFSMDTKQGSGEFVYDTNLAKRKAFNYRLGVDVGKIVYEDGTGGEVKLDELAITQDFGLGLVTGRNVRIWIGPELKVSYQRGTDENEIEWSGMGAGFGAVLGLNWNITDGPTLFLKGGVLRSTYVLDNDVSNDPYEITHSTSFANAGIMFRMNERR